jgi:hypothetical protein
MPNPDRSTRISPHDLEEVSKFSEYLEDIGKLPPKEFVAKYQAYMGLNDAEAAAYIAREEARRDA